MSKVSVIITDCEKNEFEEFVKHAGLEGAVEECEHEKGDVLCLVQGDALENLFTQMEEEANRGWSEQEPHDVLEFDSALFPRSAEEFLPMRQLRGVLAARLDKKKKNLLPAYATPGYVFGTAKT